MKSSSGLLAISLMLIIVGCGSRPVIGTHPTPEKDTLIESSAPERPPWLTEIPKGNFLGEGEDVEREKAKESAIADMLKRYAQYLGIDFKILTQIHQEEIKRLSDEVYKTQGRVITEVEALSKIITAGSEIRKIYWEKWRRDNEYTYYKYWVLGEVNEKFIEEEKQRIKKLKDWEELKKDFFNSDLRVEIKEEKGRYKPGEEVLITISANDISYLYLLNFYGEGEVEILGSKRLEKEGDYEMRGKAKYGGKGEEIIKAIVSDKELNLEEALREIYPVSIIENLRRQAKEKKARYAEKSLLILIEPE